MVHYLTVCIMLLRAFTSVHQHLDFLFFSYTNDIARNKVFIGLWKRAISGIHQLYVEK